LADAFLEAFEACRHDRQTLTRSGRRSWRWTRNRRAPFPQSLPAHRV